MNNCINCKGVIRLNAKYCAMCNKMRCREYYKNNRKEQIEKKTALYFKYKSNAKTYKRLREINMVAVTKKRFGIKSRKEILEKYKNKCSVCDSIKLLVIHHIDHNGRGHKDPNNSKENLIVVCKSCHLKHHLHKMKI